MPKFVLCPDPRRVRGRLFLFFSRRLFVRPAMVLVLPMAYIGAAGVRAQTTYTVTTLSDNAGTPPVLLPRRSVSHGVQFRSLRVSI